MSRAPRERGAWLTLIALFKFFKAAVLIAAGVGAFRLLDPARFERAHDWLLGVAWTWHPGIIPAFERQTQRLREHGTTLVGLAAFGYAVLFLVEGVGLWLAAPWGEYLTIGITSSLLPFEAWELAKRLTAPRLIALVLNLLVVLYLVWRVRARRRRAT